MRRRCRPAAAATRPPDRGATRTGGLAPPGDGIGPGITAAAPRVVHAGFGPRSSFEGHAIGPASLVARGTPSPDAVTTSHRFDRPPSPPRGSGPDRGRTPGAGRATGSGSTGGGRDRASEQASSPGAVPP